MPCASVNTLEPRLDPSRPCDYYYIEVKIINESLASESGLLEICEAESNVTYTNIEESQGCNLHLTLGKENIDTLQLKSLNKFRLCYY